MALGVPAPSGIDPGDGAAPIDRIVRAMVGTDWAALILAYPVSESAVARMRGEALSEMRAVMSEAESAGARSPLADQYVELLKGQLEAGQQIGTVAKWEGHPNDSHLHFGMSVRTGDGSYQGVDPGNALKATDGSTAGRDVTVTDDGGYIVGDQKYAPPAVPDASKPASTPSDGPPPTDPYPGRPLPDGPRTDWQR